MLPTVDHIEPNETHAAFEICSWLVNDCKAGVTPKEFIALCTRIYRFHVK